MANPTSSADPPEESAAKPADLYHRRHVFIVNSDPAFLDVARRLLQREGYNVTSTNLVPRSFLMIQAGSPDVLVVDLAIEGDEIWKLLKKLGERPTTARIPIILTAVDPALLDQAQRIPAQMGGRFLLHKPFRAEDLADAVHALAGPA